jgi:hypothetical protein
MARCGGAFAADQGTGLLIDQAFCRRIDEGIIRAYMVKDHLVGFARQYPKGLSPDDWLRPHRDGRCRQSR